MTRDKTNEKKIKQIAYITVFFSIQELNNNLRLRCWEGYRNN